MDLSSKENKPMFNFGIETALKKYEKEDIATKLKIRFVYFLIIAQIITLAILIISTAVILLINDIFNWSIIIVEILMLVTLLVCFLLLIKGYYRIVSYTILLLSFTTVWLVMFLDTGNSISRLDTIVYILVVLSTSPIIISKSKYSIFLYTAANLLMLLIFAVMFRTKFNEDNATILEFVIDSSVAILFTGIVAYNNFRINKTALDKALNDSNDRKQTEELLTKSEKKFREMAELLPQPVFESDLEGNISYVNKNGLEYFGYSEEDITSGKNLFDSLDPKEKERAKQNIIKIIDGNNKIGNQYTAIRKDGSTFQIQIYTNLIIENTIPIGLRGIIVDISERIKAEEELKKSRDQFQALVNNIPGITYRCLYDHNYTMIFISSGIEKISGYPSSDFIQNKIRTFKSIIYHEDIQFVESIIDMALNTDYTWELEYRILDCHNNLQWVYEKGNAIKDKHGKIEFLDGFILDISEKKAIEFALINSQYKYKDLFLNAPVPMASVNFNGEITGINRMFTKTLGYENEDMVSITDWWNKAYPDENYKQEVLKCWSVDINIAITNKTDVMIREYHVTDKYGKGHIMLIGANIHDDNVLASFIDITERKKAEKSLKHSEERFKTLIELLPYPVLVTDMQSRHLVVNNAYCKEIGCTKEEAIGKTSEELGYFIDKASQELAYKSLKEHGFAENIEACVTKKDNSINFIYFSSKIVQLDDHQGILSSSINITEKKKIEKELENYRENLEYLVKERTDELETANEELKAINEELYEKNTIINDQNAELLATLQNLKDTQAQLIQAEKMASLGILTAGIAHEINNPLNFIMGGANGLEEYFDEVRPEQTKNVAFLLDSIKTGVNRASAIVSSLNQFSRDKNTYDEVCDIHSIIDNCLVMLQNQVKNKIEIRKDYFQGPSSILGNVGKLHQVFINILNNAIHAIAAEGNITITTINQKKDIVIEISDSGCGISKEHLSKIADPFFTTKEPGEGTGLGLAISYTIIKEHKGKLEFKSEINKGTDVIISLPINPISYG